MVSCVFFKAWSIKMFLKDVIPPSKVLQILSWTERLKKKQRFIFLAGKYWNSWNFLKISFCLQWYVLSRSGIIVLSHKGKLVQLYVICSKGYCLFNLYLWIISAEKCNLCAIFCLLIKNYCRDNILGYFPLIMGSIIFCRVYKKNREKFQ